MSELRVRLVPSFADIDPAAWDACANPHHETDNLLEPRALRELADVAPQVERFNPFLTHAFLSACEASGSAVGRTGWGGAHVLVEDAQGRLVAAAPTWLKSHSMGEYVFDWSWAEAYERAGGNYYPKLLVGVPFTPVQGRRLLIAGGLDAAMAEAARDRLLAGLEAVREKVEASSIHVNFAPRDEWEALGEAGYLQRTGKQFHFFNRDYGSFDGFLEALASRKRKMIRRERRDAVANGIEIFPLTGAAITEEHWDAFFQFYLDTGARKWGKPYLNRAFYSRIGATMADRILLVMAKRDGRWIAGAINFIGDDALYGRNWGCVEEHPFLHFELCYYQAIEFACARGLSRVEAGAQGEHKLARGYEPVETYSAHHIADKRLARAVADFLAAEREHVAVEIDEYAEHVPFRKGEVGGSAEG